LSHSICLLPSIFYHWWWIMSHAFSVFIEVIWFFSFLC
jgi:hypothetical protein